MIPGGAKEAYNKTRAKQLNKQLPKFEIEDTDFGKQAIKAVASVRHIVRSKPMSRGQINRIASTCATIREDAKRRLDEI